MLPRISGCASRRCGTAGGRSACVCNSSDTGCAGGGCSASSGMSTLAKILIALVIVFVVFGAAAVAGIDVRRSSRAPKGERTWLVAFRCRRAREQNGNAAESMVAICCRSQRWALLCTWKLCGLSTEVTMRQDALTA